MAYKDPEKARENQRKRYADNPERGREYQRKYREANHEKLLEKQRKRYADNLERGRGQQCKYREANLEKVRERHRKSVSARSRANAAPRVYFVSPTHGRTVKIGRTTKNPKTRLTVLQCGHDEDLKFLAYVALKTPEQAKALEITLHDHFKAERVRKTGERFVMSDRLRKFTERVGFNDPTGLAAAAAELEHEAPR